MATTRIYVVKIGKDDQGKAKKIKLVEAATASQAQRHAVKGLVEVKVATSLEVANMMKIGTPVEVAGDEPEATT